jgi:hypothetical protein
MIRQLHQNSTSRDMPLIPIFVNFLKYICVFHGGEKWIVVFWVAILRFFDIGGLALLWYFGRTLSSDCYLKIKK